MLMLSLLFDVGPVTLPQPDQGHLQRALLYSILPLMGITFLVVFMFYLWRRRQTAAYHHQLPTHDQGAPLAPPSPEPVGRRPIDLLEVKARGRFGCVYKAQMGNSLVAVKVFPLQDKASWATEKAVYYLPQLNGHPNILQFIGAERRGENLNTDLWLITAFHEHGSLYDYLKGHLVTWPQLLVMAESMARGLAYLHEDLPPTTTAAAKPAIAHRDFKSKNVLIKSDLSTCIADFGLALTFENGASVSDTHGQVSHSFSNCSCHALFICL